MSHARFDFELSFRNMNKQEWTAQLAKHVSEHGSFAPLGESHMAAYTASGATLLVSFETQQSIQSLSPKAHPLGWGMVASHRWSHLAIISEGDTWFRDTAVYDYFDGLVDQGFFDTFDSVLFYGAGSCGYAAAAFSVAAPGARVVALQPQATLDPTIAGWDTRFAHMRRTNFCDRYGYAPDMLDAAMHAFVVYDPFEAEDAMHAALFSHPAVTRLRMPHMGGALQAQIISMDLLAALLTAAENDSLTPASFAKLARARRDHMPYLRRLLHRLDHEERTNLIFTLCRNVAQRKRAPRFSRRLRRLTESRAD